MYEYSSEKNKLIGWDWIGKETFEPHWKDFGYDIFIYNAQWNQVIDSKSDCFIMISNENNMLCWKKKTTDLFVALPLPLIDVESYNIKEVNT